jgi:peptidoglycan/LPS O-acetylase OafA/YrhL
MAGQWWMMTDWKIYLAVVLTALCLWRSEARLLRLVAVAVNLVVTALFLSNVGRNTFEQPHGHESTSDTFAEGVFAEAKAADAFARAQLPAVYVIATCLGLLAVWPAVAKRKGKVP